MQNTMGCYHAVKGNKTSHILDQIFWIISCLIKLEGNVSSEVSLRGERQMLDDPTSGIQRSKAKQRIATAKEKTSLVSDNKTVITK